MKEAVAAVMAGERAKEIMARAMAEFHAACVSGNWDETERARQISHDALDAFFDNLAGLYRMRKVG